VNLARIFELRKPHTEGAVVGKNPLVNMTSVHIQEFPNEVLIHMMSHLPPKDIVACASIVCKRWYEATMLHHDTGNELWKNICLRRWNIWSQLDNILDLGSLHIKREANQWLKILEEKSHALRNFYNEASMFENVNTLIEAQYHFEYYKTNIDKPIWLKIFIERTFKDIRSIRLLQKTMWNHKLELEILNECCNMDVDVFERLCNAEQASNNLTFKYFANKVLFRLHNQQIFREWKEFIKKCDQSGGNILMIDGALLLSKMLSIRFDSKSHTYNLLDQLVEDVKNHAIEVNLDTSYEHEMLFEIVNQEMYEKWHFHGNSDNYYNLDNCFIHTAIKNRTGIPITLCAIYQYVCKKAFGIELQPIGAPGHFILKWKHGNKYIDAFNKGKQLSHFYLPLLVLYG
jgi:hypothetical protein